MAHQKPSVPKGTRDFTPVEMIRRNYLFDTIRAIFQNFGYLPIETPAIENLATLLGKYGDEGDKLLFRILNSGDYLKGAQGTGHGAQGTETAWHHGTTSPLTTNDLAWFTNQITEKGLRYDLTVPLARFVVQHQHELIFPFKRYQIQPVWRADRPQKGRYREFFQCDVDVIGSQSLLNELELIQIIDTVFTTLHIPVTIHLNHRKVLYAMVEMIGEKERLTEITGAIDKLDKLSMEQVIRDLADRGVTQKSIEQLQPFLMMEGTANIKLDTISSVFQDSVTGLQGVEEIRHLIHLLEELKIHSPVKLDLSLARGLNYYTGTIIEVRSNQVQIGSICGGGRYDNLTGIFGLPGVSGVGISFGADRIYDVMMEMNLFPETLHATTKILFINFGPEEERYCLQALQTVRLSGIAAELYPDPAKLKKQLDYANRKHIPYVILAGKDEMSQNMLTVKDMQTGIQKSLKNDQLIQYLSP